MKAEIQALLAKATRETKRLQRKGWTKKDFVNALKKTLTEPT